MNNYKEYYFSLVCIYKSFLINPLKNNKKNSKKERKKERNKYK